MAEPITTDGKENGGDQHTIEELFTIIEVDSIPTSIVRIGRNNDGKKRPIKIRMSNLNDKELVMSNLSKLKTAPEIFKKISITDDYTAEEREAIKRKVEEARKKSIAEGQEKYIWKVRGTPKNGLTLRRFIKNNPGIQTQNG